MIAIAQKFFLLMILLSGVQVVQLPFINVSLFQISIMVTIIVGFIACIGRGEIYSGKYLAFVIMFEVSSILAWSISTNPTWAKSYMLLNTMTAAVVFLCVNLFDYKDIDVLEKTVVRSQYIVFPFSMYNFYMFYFKGGMPSVINLFAGLTIPLDQESLLRGQAASQVRFMLPYSTPPVLSVAMAMCIILLVTNKNLYKMKMRLFLIVAYGIILLMTGSRTGILGLALGLCAMQLRKWCYNSIKINLGRFILGSIIAFTLFFILPLGLNIEYISKMINRFMSFGFFQDRHVLVPLDGFLLWMSSVKNFIIGIGTGSSVNIVGEHTYLPPYFLNSFVTLVAERGLLGLSIIILLVSLVVSLFYKAKKITDSQRERIAFCLLTGFFCCMFYEAMNCYMLIFVLSISFLTDRSVVVRNEKEVRK